mmetsp:Transcript_107682/g.304606  ORF Transcript_107682/g.304606 Transcript_107682/m.304606 type:complete len:462 (-) Transcript_107682:505-1890(-)
MIDSAGAHASGDRLPTAVPPDLRDHLVVDLLGPRHLAGELVALLMDEHHRVLVVVLLALVAEAVACVLVVLVSLAIDEDRRVPLELLVDEVEIVLVADVHGIEKDAGPPGHLFGRVPGMMPSVWVCLSAPHHFLPEVANDHVQEYATLREADHGVKRTLLVDVGDEVLDRLLQVKVLDTGGGVELLVSVQPVRLDMGLQAEDLLLLPSLLMTPVTVPVLELLPTGDPLFHLTGLGLALVPLEVMVALEVHKLCGVPAQRRLELVGLELDHGYTGVAACQAQHAQLPERHVLEVLEDHGRRPRRHYDPARGVRKAAAVARLRHHARKNFAGPRLGTRQLVAVVVLQDHRVLVVVLRGLAASRRALVVVVLVGLAEDHDRGVRHLLFGQRPDEGVVADGQGTEHDAHPPRDWLAQREQLCDRQVHDQAPLEHCNDDVNWAFFIDVLEDLVHGGLVTLICDLDV